MENAQLKEEVLIHCLFFYIVLLIGFVCISMTCVCFCLISLSFLLFVSSQLDRVSSIAAKYIGRPISQLPPVQPIHVSSLDLTMGSFGGPSGLSVGPSLDLDLLPGGSSTMPNLPYQQIVLSDMDKSLMSDIATSAMEEMLRLLQTNDPLWLKSPADGREVLNLDAYERMFSRASSHLKNPNIRTESSRDSGVVIMNALALVDMFMDSVSIGYLCFDLVYLLDGSDGEFMCRTNGWSYFPP